MLEKFFNLLKTYQSLSNVSHHVLRSQFLLIKLKSLRGQKHEICLNNVNDRCHNMNGLLESFKIAYTHRGVNLKCAGVGLLKLLWGFYFTRTLGTVGSNNFLYNQQQFRKFQHKYRKSLLCF